jgi:hypothetical protein
MEYWGMARSYRAAADVLGGEWERRASSERDLLSSPTNLLYLHAIELALKAFLRAHDRPIVGKLRDHRLTVLYDQCRRLGLAVAPEDQVREVVRYLDCGNEGHGFRYFAPGSASEPAIAWTREIVDPLFRAIEGPVMASKSIATNPEHSVRSLITFGKPVPKS